MDFLLINRHKLTLFAFLPKSSCLLALAIPKHFVISDVVFQLTIVMETTNPKINPEKWKSLVWKASSYHYSFVLLFLRYTIFMKMEVVKPTSVSGRRELTNHHFRFGYSIFIFKRSTISSRSYKTWTNTINAILTIRSVLLISRTLLFELRWFAQSEVIKTCWSL